MAVLGSEALPNSLAGGILNSTAIHFAARANGIGRKREQRAINETLIVC